MAVAAALLAAVPALSHDAGATSDCRAEGSEHLTPELTGEEACAAFAAALDAALAEAGAMPASHPQITVELHFTRTGTSRAEVRHAGESARWFVVNFAVMDRALPAAAAERLAAQVARELMSR